MLDESAVLSSNKTRTMHYDYYTTQLFSCIVTWLSVTGTN